MSLPFIIGTLQLCVDGKISALVMYSRGTVGYHSINIHDLADTLFEILDEWGT